MNFTGVDEVIAHGDLVLSRITELSQKALEQPIQLHLRGGCPELSEELLKAVEGWAKINKMVIASNKTLFPWGSDQRDGTSLLIDSRNGVVSEYNPQENPYHRAFKDYDSRKALTIAYWPQLPNSTKSLDSSLREKIHLTWNKESSDYNPYYKDLGTLKSAVEKLDKSKSLGYFASDFKTIRWINQVVGFLSDKLQENTISNVESPSLLSPTPSEIADFNNIRTLFQGVFDRYNEFLSVMSSDLCSPYDATEDSLIQRINYPFSFEQPSQRKLTIIVDKDNAYTPKLSSIIDKLFGWNSAPGTSYLYITDSFGKKWRATGIPIGPRALTGSIDTLDILAKKTRDNGEIVIRPLFADLPDHMKTLILNFIKQGRPSTDFVCFNFVEMLQKDEGSIEYSLFIDEKSLFPGDAICLTSMKREETETDLCEFVRSKKSHFALYLGHKLYLSISGNTGPLNIGSLQAMLQCNAYKDVIVMRTLKAM